MRYLAFDLGAESGRAVVGTLEGSRLYMEEVHRFPNAPVVVHNTKFWDILRLFNEIKKGIRIASEGYGAEIESLGIDSWGVDFGFLGEEDYLLGNPYHYRDGRTKGMMEEAFGIMTREEIFARTGIQFMHINSLYQLLAFRKQHRAIFNQVRTLLLIPDLLNYFLTGRKAGEATVASTTQMYNPWSGSWDKEILERFKLPREIFPQVIEPGTILGNLLPRVSREIRSKDMAVIAPGSHDTASAVAAVPSESQECMYVSSGTWMLAGVEVESPVVNRETLALNFTNEYGVGGKTRLLRNMTGLWLVQECRRCWMADGEKLDYEQITFLAGQAGSLVTFIDPDHPSFLNPKNMPAAIQEFCRETGQPVPATKGEIIRCALESLALKTRWILEKLENLLGHKLSVIHMVGGGTRNELLCRFVAQATGREVFAGPVEATAMGNLLTQAMAMGQVESLSELKSIVRLSSNLKGYKPQSADRWEAAYQKMSRHFS